MTVATQTRSWQREPVGDPSPPPCCVAAPSLFPLLDWLIAVHGGKSLSTKNLWHDRPVRGGSVPSSHRGAAFDWRYENPGKGRRYMLDSVLPLLIDDSLEFNVQQIHDYVGCRVWKASRSGDSGGGWARQNPGSHSGMMGSTWAQWLHVEAGEWAWNDDRPIPEKMGGAPPPEEEADMLMLARGGDGSNWVIGSDLTRFPIWPDDWNAMVDAKVAVEVPLRPDTVDRFPQTGQLDVIGDQAGQV